MALGDAAPRTSRDNKSTYLSYNRTIYLTATYHTIFRRIPPNDYSLFNYSGSVSYSENSTRSLNGSDVYDHRTRGTFNLSLVALDQDMDS